MANEAIIGVKTKWLWFPVNQFGATLIAKRAPAAKGISKAL